MVVFWPIAWALVKPYDPFQATIDWNALFPYINNWCEIIINHMVSDSMRAVKMVKVVDSITQLILEQAQQSGDYIMTTLHTIKEKTIPWPTTTKET